MTLCRNGAKSGLRSGTRMASVTCPPPALKLLAKVSSASSPGANSVTSVTALPRPFFAAQSAKIAEDCASVQLARTKKGDFSITAVLLEIMITTGFLRPSRLSLFDSWEKKVKAAVPLLADKNLKAFGQATEFATTLQLFRFHADAQKVIDDTRDTTFRKGPDVDVKAAWAAAAKQINDIEAKGSV